VWPSERVIVWAVSRPPLCGSGGGGPAFPSHGEGRPTCSVTLRAVRAQAAAPIGSGELAASPVCHADATGDGKSVPVKSPGRRPRVLRRALRWPGTRKLTPEGADDVPADELVRDATRRGAAADRFSVSEEPGGAVAAGAKAHGRDSSMRLPRSRNCCRMSSTSTVSTGRPRSRP
jgi:hypothetical protein